MERSELRDKLNVLIPRNCRILPVYERVGPCGLRRPCGLMQAVELLEETDDSAGRTSQRPFKD